MKTLIEKIRTARAGKEAREPIAQALLIIHGLLATSVENEDVVQARGSYSRLHERMDVNKRKVETAKSEIDGLISIFEMQEGV